MNSTGKKQSIPLSESPLFSFLSSRSAIIALSLFIAAFLVRLLYLIQISSTLTFTHPLMDSLFYINRSREIAAGTYDATQAFFMGPFYPYFLAFIIKLLGFGWMKIRIVQIIIGSLSVVMIYQIAMRCFHEEKIALPAAIASLFWGTLIYYDTNLLMSFLVVFLNLLLLWSLLGLLHNPVPKRFFISGIILGFSAISRGNILLFVPFCLFWFYRAFRSQFSISILGKRAGIFLLGTALLILPVTARNYLVENDLVLLTSNGGLNFYIGNNPYSKGIYIPLDQLKLPYEPTPSSSGDRMDIQARKIAEKVVGRKLKSSETSAFWYDQAQQFIHREPGVFLSNLATKVALCWNKAEIPQIENFYFFQNRFSLLGVPLLDFGIFAPLALWGIVLGLRSKKQEIGLLIFYLVAMTLAISLFFVTSRYRTPMTPVALILASFALADLVHRLRHRDWTGVGKGVLGVGIFALLVNQPMVHNDLAADHYNLGSIYYQTGEWDKAIEEFSTCLSILPGYTDAYRARGIIYRRRRLYAEAMTEFEKALTLRPDYLDVSVNIALVYLEQNRLREARHELEQVLAKDGEFYIGLVAMGRLLWAEGRAGEAKTTLNKAIKVSPEKSDALILLGQIFVSESRFDLAITNFQKAIDTGDANASLYYNLGLSYHRTGQLIYAEEALKQANAKDPSLTEVYIALGNLFFDLNRFNNAVEEFEIAYRRQPNVSNQYNLANAYAGAGWDDKAEETYKKLLLILPDHTRALNNLGNVFLNKKQYDDAISCYQQALRIDPQSSVALHNLGDIYKEYNDSARALDYYRQSLELEKDPQLKSLLENKIKKQEKDSRRK